MRITGYSDNTKVAHTAKKLREEIREATETLLAMYAPKGRLCSNIHLWKPRYLRCKAFNLSRLKKYWIEQVLLKKSGLKLRVIRVVFSFCLQNRSKNGTGWMFVRDHSEGLWVHLSACWVNKNSRIFSDQTQCFEYCHFNKKNHAQKDKGEGNHFYYEKCIITV